MSVVDLFKPISLWSAAELKEWLRNTHPEEYQLLDVRQVQEYNQGHIPGAVSIPVWELPERLDEISSQLQTVVYCRFGLRSRAAAAMLHGAGCRAVATLKGGFEAWRGEIAQGGLDKVLAVLNTTEIEKFIAVAWLLEDGTQRLYELMAVDCRSESVKSVFKKLARAEGEHKKTLESLFEGLVGHSPSDDFAYVLLEQTPQDILVEGGASLDEIRQWAADKSDVQRVDLAIAVETNAYDRYLLLRRKLTDEHLKRIVEVVAGDERRHLYRLIGVYDDLLRGNSSL